MQFFNVETYDANDDPAKDGDWTLVGTRVPASALQTFLREACGHYDCLSLNIMDSDTGEMLPEAQWPQP